MVTRNDSLWKTLDWVSGDGSAFAVPAMTMAIVTSLISLPVPESSLYGLSAPLVWDLFC